MKLHERPGYKRVPVTIVLHLYETVQEDWDDDGRFYVEENHCLDNQIEAVHASIVAKPNVCHTCIRGQAYLGHIDFEAIRGVQPEPGTTNPHAKDEEA